TIEARRIALWKEKGVIPEDSVFVKGNPVGWIVSEHPPQGHVTIGIKKVLDIGFSGIEQQAEQKLADLRDRGKESRRREEDFWQSVRLTSRAVCKFAERYAALAEKMAERSGSQRKKEL